MIDWDDLQIAVVDPDTYIITSDENIYTIDAEQRMIVFTGARGETGPQGPQGPAGSSASETWGAITGNINDQTDLQTALNAKANTADLGDLATQDTVDYTTEVTNKPTLGALAGMDSIDYTSAYLTNKPTLGALASKDTADYATDLTNKPTLGALAGMDSISYSSNYLTDKPTLGTMASVNDAPSDNTEYARKNGQWVISSGGGGGGGASWGAITGTLSNQTDLQTALNAKADVTDITLNVFSESENYSYGQLVIYHSLLYRFVDNHTAGPWDRSDVSRITVSDLLNLKADVQSPALTGTPTAPSPTAGDSSTKIATTAYVQGEIAGKANTSDLGDLASMDTVPVANGGTSKTSISAVKDYFGLWFKAGDSFSVSSGKGSYTGFLNTTTNARCVIPLTKPVKPNTTVSLTGQFRIRTQTKATTITVTGLSCTVTNCGLAVDISDGSTTLGEANEPCSVGVNTQGMTISFS